MTTSIYNNYSNRQDLKASHSHQNNSPPRKAQAFSGRKTNNMTTNAKFNQELMKMRTPGEVFKAWDTRKNEFNEVNYATALKQLVQMRSLNQRDESQLESMMQEMPRFLPQMNYITLSNFAINCAKCSRGKEQAFREIEVEFLHRYEKDNVSGIQVKQIAAFVGSFGQASSGSAQLFSALTKVIVIVAKSLSFSQIELSQIANGFANSEKVSDEIVFFFENELKPRVLRRAEPRSLATFVNCIAKNKTAETSLLHSLETELLERYREDRLRGFNFLDISNIVHGMAKSEKGSDAFYKALSDVIQRRFMENCLSDFGIQALANIAQGFSKIESECTPVLVAIEGALLEPKRKQELLKGDTQHLSSLANSYARANCKREALFTLLKEVIVTRSDVKGLHDFENASLALILHAFSKFEFFDSSLFSSIQRELLNRHRAKGLHKLDWIDIVNISNGFRNSKFDCRDLFSALEEAILQKFENEDTADLDLRGISHIVCCYAENELGSKKFFVRFEEQVRCEYAKNRLSSCDTLNLSYLVHGFARCKLLSGKLYDIFKQMVQLADLSRFEFSHLAACIAGFSFSQRQDEELFSLFKNEILRRAQLHLLEINETINLCNLAHAFAKQNSYSKELFQILEDAFFKIVEEKGFLHFDGGQIGTLAFAFSKGGKSHEKVMHALEKMVLEHHEKNELSGFSTDHLSAIAHNFERAEIKAVKLFNVLAKRIFKLYKEYKLFKNGHLFANLVYAYASGGYGNKELFVVFEKELLYQYKKNRFQDFEMFSFSYILSALAKTGFLSVKLFTAIEEVIIERFERNAHRTIEAQSLSVIVNACSDREHTFGTKKFYAAIEAHIVAEWQNNQLKEFSSQSIVNILLGFAKVGYGEKLFDVVEDVLVQAYQKDGFRDFTAQGLSNSLWALAATRRYQSQAFLALKEVIEKRVDLSGLELNSEHLMQLTQVNLFLRLKKAEQFKGCIAEQLLSFDVKKHTASTTSRSQRDFFNTLRKLKPELTEKDNFEQYVECLSVDILIQKEKRIFEYQGPTHYQFFDSTDCTGTTRFKLDLLALLGYEIVSIPYTKWDELETPEEKLDVVGQILSQL